MVRLFLAEWDLVWVCVFLLRWGSLRSQRDGVKYLMTFTDHPQRQSHVCLFLKCVCVSHSDSFMLPDHERLHWTLHPWHRDSYKNVCVCLCDSHNRSAAGEGVLSLMSWIGKRLIFNRWLFSPYCEKAIHQSESVHFY